MKIKFFIINLLISFVLLTSNAFSKALPPGSGIGDVPANVLILLDRSGSMSARMISGVGVNSPMGQVFDSNGDVYVAQLYGGVKKFTYDTKLVDKSFANSGIFSGVTTSGTMCNLSYVYSMGIHDGNLYIADYLGGIYKIDIASGACLWKSSDKYYVKIKIKGDILYAKKNGGGLYVRNLSTEKDISCNAITNKQINNSYSIGLDASGSNFYFQRFRYIYRHAITNNCPSANNTSRIYIKSLQYSWGMEGHPTDDSILYVTNFNQHKLYKYTMNANRNMLTSTSSKGSRGGVKSTASNVKSYYPRGMVIDTTNNRIAVADYWKPSIQFYDLDLGWLKEIGGSMGTRMTGAHEAIQAITSDPALKAGVNFGFGWWSSQWRGGANWFTGWNTKKDQGNPCSSNNCLKVKVNAQGAEKTWKVVKSVSASGGTDAAIWSRMASQYYANKTHSPIDDGSPCQNSYVLVIGDGGWGNHSTAIQQVTNMRMDGIKTFTVAFGGGVGTSGINNFRAVSIAGGTKDVIIADNTASLKSQLKAAISQIIAAKLSFTAPAITATIEKGGDLFQAQFDYQQNKEWNGTLTRTAIDSDGNIDSSDTWSAADLMPNPDARKIWTIIDADYKSGGNKNNNFVAANLSDITGLFERLGNEVAGYHSENSNNDPPNTTRCSGSSGDGSSDIENGNDDDIKGLINFIRGEDYFDYDSDCNLTEVRANPITCNFEKCILGDIYHSEMVVVDKPNAETAFVGANQEAYWRSIKGYKAWAKSKENRESIIYVGANDGMLHAFSVKTGVEKWAFIPPFIGGRLPEMVNANLNRKKEHGYGGSNAIYGVDGSPVVHDMYFIKPGTNGKAWYTILMIPYGRGGAGFSVLDITDPGSPEHLYSIYNDYILKKVHFVDHLGKFDEWEYIATHYGLASFNEAKRTKDNAEDSSTSQTCDSSGNTQCHKAKVWTLPIRGLKAADLIVTKDQQPYTTFTVSADGAGYTVLTFAEDMTYYGFDVGASDETKGSTDLGVEIKSSSTATGLLNKPEYDYSKLGDTWSAPRIIRLPTEGRDDVNSEDDVYVAVMGGGYAAVTPGVGSNLTIVNLEKGVTGYGEVLKVIDIPDIPGNSIINAVPGSPVVITPDTARGVRFRGALVYTSDLEGKITKFNLTNMTHEQANQGGLQIDLYQNTTLFSAGATSTNQRYMFHSMDATIGETTNSMWLYAGTGNYERIADKSAGVDNLLLGINDPYYPRYRDIKTATKAPDLSECVNTTNDLTGAKCPQLTKDKGWYIKLDNYEKVTAEPTVSSGLVYFPIYKPTTSVNACSLGEAFICAVDDECGTNLSSRLGKRNTTEKCTYVGKGVLSRIVTFAGKLFANIAGESEQSKKDLVQIEGTSGDVSTYRNSWKMNY